LVAFRDECLPVLLHPDAPPSRFEERDRSTRQWREAVDRLLTALPISPTGEGEAPPERADFEPFLEPSASAFPPVVVGGRIAWRVELFMGWEWGAEQVLSLLDSRTPGLEPLEGLRRDLTEVKRRLMALPTDECHLYNLLCYSLPPIADIDPAFAALALDPETWRAIVLADRGLDEEIRGRRLRAVDGLYFHHVLNNALLHVMGSLANNHFDVVRDRLDHPDLLGRYTALMPRYLFAVLFEKVRVLHGFARSESDDLT
jgi:hypothetical protein